ncbi:polyprenol monophosphomannose synthase [Microbacterium sp. PRC9]|uniref:polyprenol monophosphomannose synthase n=1 Tax=Microbacterium sp. PRC9 TaxID=2962591 RepID=UPI0028824E32|nr:polyprenol monophosphomannose synthase [Microbacterium sp. PRC9]MDT0141094.1 polyprenol monophosphomannose synthase [Microbacterium sp. PRC9]
MNRTLVIIPTYDERENIESIVRRALGSAQVDVLVVDDGSPDGTADIVDAMARADDRISLMRRAGKGGLGAAYTAGFAYAHERGYELVVEMDADGSHPPERLDAMIARFDHDASDLGCVIGSRWVKGGSVVNWPAHRRLISRAGSLYARLMLGVPVRDVTAGYRVYPTAVLQRLDLGSIESKGYCFQIDMTRRVHGAGLRIVELPIEFRERELGQSKMSGAIVVEAMWRVTVWGFQRAAGGTSRVFGQRG